MQPHVLFIALVSFVCLSTAVPMKSPEEIERELAEDSGDEDNFVANQDGIENPFSTEAEGQTMNFSPLEREFRFYVHKFLADIVIDVKRDIILRRNYPGWASTTEVQQRKLDQILPLLKEVVNFDFAHPMITHVGAMSKALSKLEDSERLTNAHTDAADPLLPWLQILTLNKDAILKSKDGFFIGERHLETLKEISSGPIEDKADKQKPTKTSKASQLIERVTRGRITRK